jgi:hypothetical protein
MNLKQFRLSSLFQWRTVAVAGRQLALLSLVIIMVVKFTA